ncbi:hypothetical protein MTR67_011833 [Solanum verrucosum]|uniref:Uncharacterized protein n=1 Tax=Solanum verrucosum TaxID=315347 RepID=A0AAF0Q8T7_SOLVR|nr:hypothetical protein MTR67_011833 [Solanum verrucosum]
MRIAEAIGRAAERPSSRLCPEGKDQVGDEREQSAHRRIVSRSSTISSNDSKREEAEGKS